MTLQLQTMALSEMVPIIPADVLMHQFMLDGRRYIVLTIKGVHYAMTCDLAFIISGTLIDVLEAVDALPAWARNETGDGNG